MKDDLAPGYKYCCDEWLNSHGTGTGNEGYNYLVTYYKSGFPEIGYGLPPVRFCPWCGVAK